MWLWPCHSPGQNASMASAGRGDQIFTMGSKGLPCLLDLPPSPFPLKHPALSQIRLFCCSCLRICPCGSLCLHCFSITVPDNLCLHCLQVSAEMSCHMPSSTSLYKTLRLHCPLPHSIFFSVVCTIPHYIHLLRYMVGTYGCLLNDLMKEWGLANRRLREWCLPSKLLPSGPRCSGPAAQGMLLPLVSAHFWGQDPVMGLAALVRQTMAPDPTWLRKGRRGKEDMAVGTGAFGWKSWKETELLHRRGPKTPRLPSPTAKFKLSSVRGGFIWPDFLGGSRNLCKQLLFQMETPSLSQVTQVPAPRGVRGHRTRTWFLPSGGCLCTRLELGWVLAQHPTP